MASHEYRIRIAGDPAATAQDLETALAIARALYPAERDRCIARAMADQTAAPHLSIPRVEILRRIGQGVGDMSLTEGLDPAWIAVPGPCVLGGPDSWERAARYRDFYLGEVLLPAMRRMIESGDMLPGPGRRFIRERMADTGELERLQLSHERCALDHPEGSA
jgi:hypothetical protein